MQTSSRHIRGVVRHARVVQQPLFQAPDCSGFPKKPEEGKKKNQKCLHVTCHMIKFSLYFLFSTSVPGLVCISHRVREAGPGLTVASLCG